MDSCEVVGSLPGRSQTTRFGTPEPQFSLTARSSADLSELQWLRPARCAWTRSINTRNNFVRCAPASSALRANLSTMHAAYTSG